MFNQVYPQLAGVDLRNDARTLGVPVYMIVGRHDVNAMTSLVEEYYEMLDAPHKEVIWFEKSGHPPLYSESDRVIDVMRRVKQET